MVGLVGFPNAGEGQEGEGGGWCLTKGPVWDVPVFDPPCILNVRRVVKRPCILGPYIAPYTGGAGG